MAKKKKKQQQAKKKLSYKELGRLYIKMGIVGYFLIVFLLCHMVKVDISDIDNYMNNLLLHVFTSPFDIFPINWQWVGIVSFFYFLAAAALQVSYEKQRDVRADSGGSAVWNDDYGAFSSQYAEPFGEKDIEQKTGWIDIKTGKPWKGLSQKGVAEKRTKSIFVALGKLIARRFQFFKDSLRNKWLDFLEKFRKKTVVHGEEEYVEPTAFQRKIYDKVCALEEKLDMDLERYKPKCCVAEARRLKEEAERAEKQRLLDGHAARLRRHRYLDSSRKTEKLSASLSPVNRNMILSQNVALSMNGRETRKNCNTLILGGSGAGKTRFFLKPNLMQLNCSYVITDPSGEILQTMGKFLENAGYEIKVINLTNMDQSHCYNPFAYVREDADILVMIDVLTKNLTPPDSHSSDPFWPKAQAALLQAIAFYLYKECRPSERNFTNVMKLLRAAIIKDDGSDYKSPLDIIFEDLEKKDPNHIAVMQYSIFKQAPGKTASTILTCAQVDLAPFNLDTIANLTCVDTIDMGTIGLKPTALFCITPTAKTTYNWIISLAYTQLFETLYYTAETKCKGLRLPVHVRFLLDEFANIGQIPDFEQKLSTMRKYEISCAIIIQNMAQLETMYKESWKTIVGNCDEFIYLGGHESSSTEYVSKMLGKQTIKSKNSSKTYGRQGSSNISLNATGRELMTPDEIAHMSDQDCLVMVKGVMPFFDKKYDLLKHPNYPYTGDADDDLLFNIAEEIRTPQNNVFGSKSKAARRNLEVQAKSDTRLTDRRMPMGVPRKSPAAINAENMEEAGMYNNVYNQDEGMYADMEVTAANPSLNDYGTPPEVEAESDAAFADFVNEESSVPTDVELEDVGVEEDVVELMDEEMAALVQPEMDLDDEIFEDMAAVVRPEMGMDDEALEDVPAVVQPAMSLDDELLAASQDAALFVQRLQSLNEVDFAVVGAETTGRGNDDEIIELSVVDKSGSLMYSSLFQNQNSISPETAAANGLTDESLLGAKLFVDEWERIKMVLNEKRILAFDAEFVQRALRQTLTRYDLNPEDADRLFDGHLDAMRIYLGICPGDKEPVSLQQCCDNLGMNTTVAHRADGDCRMVLEMLRRLDGVKEEEIVK